MLRSMIILAILTVLSFITVGGCSKKTDESDSEPIDLKSIGEYQKDAEKEINSENMMEKLDSLEKELEKDM